MAVTVSKKYRRRPIKYKQQEMFPTEFHPYYKVMGHSYYIDEHGNSIWLSSDITWRKK